AEDGPRPADAPRRGRVLVHARMARAAAAVRARAPDDARLVRLSLDARRTGPRGRSAVRPEDPSLALRRGADRGANGSRAHGMNARQAVIFARAFAGARWGRRITGRAALERRQAVGIERLLRERLPRASFYRAYAGRPLVELPIVDKRAMMDAFAGFNVH